MSDQSLRVLITGAAGQIAYSLVPIVARGDVFGREQPVTIVLLDIPPMAEVLNGVVMEIVDCAFPLVTDIVATTNEAEAFTDIDYAFLVGSMPRKQGMERKDLLAANVKIFKSQGKALADHAKPNCRVLVVGNPANTNALICSKFAAPKIPPQNITAMTRLDQNRAIAQVALKAQCPAREVKNVIIWGNHSSTQFPDISNATCCGKKLPFTGHDETFISTIQKRGAAVIAARKLSSAMSAAKAAADHMHDWHHGTSDMVSMGVYSDGTHYGAPKDVVFSFPVTICPKTKEYKIVDGLSLDDFAKEKLVVTGKELEEERSEALAATELSS
ncbi:malate dehydrogenase: cytoplasmic-like protein [Dinothrombium tinctorium]|uniref:Malate dehydrogenase n=1 Tax=Dinothrombium tinctorium TaxID=1965070 RepID=A0A3S3NVG3_9ACAR|nr:malate dehydrogenase: cytoplasmic-like protein [Dinothrombium tinctorium]RWS02690.1 malate dehydrogenase: cytoplasmic-like protein [Dinothrombium tinctorium]